VGRFLILYGNIKCPELISGWHCSSHVTTMYHILLHGILDKLQLECSLYFLILAPLIKNASVLMYIQLDEEIRSFLRNDI
jgi:hypothetical protein